MIPFGKTLFLGGAVAALSFGWLGFPKVLYRSQAQPLQFNHKTHTGEKVGYACKDCHTIGEDGRFSGVPGVAACATCHAAPVTDTANEKRLVEEYVTPNREIPWLIYSRQPDNVSFSHAVHVRTGKLECERCHGEHGKTETLRPYEENRLSGYSRDIWGQAIARISMQNGARPGMKMSDCEECHAEKKVQAGCLGCHK